MQESLKDGSTLSLIMPPKAKDPDQEQAEAFHEQYRFLVETLKAEDTWAV